MPVTTADSCKKLANGAGREYRGILNNDANYITGCFEWTASKGDKKGSSQYVYFNTRVSSSLVAKIGGHRLCQGLQTCDLVHIS